MDVEIYESKVFTIKANGVEIADLKEVSRWEFFAKLQTPRGESLIIATEPSGVFSGKFFGFFDIEKTGARKVIVVGGTPSLIALLTTEKNDAGKGGAA